MSNRMSLEEAKRELTYRGFYVLGTSHNGYRVWKDGVDHTNLITGRGVVKFAKEVLLKEYDKNHNITPAEEVVKDPEILAEMRTVWKPGTKIINVITGEEMVI